MPYWDSSPCSAYRLQASASSSALTSHSNQHSPRLRIAPLFLPRLVPNPTSQVSLAAIRLPSRLTPDCPVIRPLSCPFRDFSDSRRLPRVGRLACACRLLPYSLAGRRDYCNRRAKRASPAFSTFCVLAPKLLTGRNRELFTRSE